MNAQRCGLYQFFLQLFNIIIKFNRINLKTELVELVQSTGKKNFKKKINKKK